LCSIGLIGRGRGRGAGGRRGVDRGVGGDGRRRVISVGERRFSFTIDVSIIIMLATHNLLFH
jgi:hypothetical protein